MLWFVTAFLHCYQASFVDAPDTGLTTDNFPFPSVEAGYSMWAKIPSFAVGSEITWLSYATKDGCKTDGIKSKTPTVDCLPGITDCCDGGVDFSLGFNYPNEQLMQLVMTVGGERKTWAFTSMKIDTWTLFAISRGDDGNVTIYADGIKLYENQVFNAFKIAPGGTLAVGTSLKKMATASPGCTGYLDDVFIRSKIFTNGVVIPALGTVNEYLDMLSRHTRSDISWTDYDYYTTFPHAVAYYPFSCADGERFKDLRGGHDLTAHGSATTVPSNPVQAGIAVSIAVLPTTVISGGDYTMCARVTGAGQHFDPVQLVTFEVGPVAAPNRPHKYYRSSTDLICGQLTATDGEGTQEARVYLAGKQMGAHTMAISTLCLDNTLFSPPKDIFLNQPFQVLVELHECHHDKPYTGTDVTVDILLHNDYLTQYGMPVRGTIFTFNITNSPSDVELLTWFTVSAMGSTAIVGHEHYRYQSGATPPPALPPVDLGLTTIAPTAPLQNDTRVTPGSVGHMCWAFKDTGGAPIALTQAQVDAYVALDVNGYIERFGQVDGSKVCADIHFDVMTSGDWYTDAFRVTPIYGNVSAPVHAFFVVAQPVDVHASRFVEPRHPLLGATVDYCISLFDGHSNPTVLGPGQTVTVKLNGIAHVATPTAFITSVHCITAPIHSLTAQKLEADLGNDRIASLDVTVTPSSSFNVTDQLYIGEKAVVCLTFTDARGATVDPGSPVDMTLLTFKVTDGEGTTMPNLYPVTMTGATGTYRVYCGDYDVPTMLPANREVTFAAVWGTTQFLQHKTTIVDKPYLPNDVIFEMAVPGAALSSMATELCFTMKDSQSKLVVDFNEIFVTTPVDFLLNFEKGSALNTKFFDTGVPYRTQVGTICTKLDFEMYLGHISQGFYFTEITASLGGATSEPARLFLQRTRIPNHANSIVGTDPSLPVGSYLDPADKITLEFSPISITNGPNYWSTEDVTKNVRLFDSITWDDLTDCLSDWKVAETGMKYTYTADLTLTPPAPGKHYLLSLWYGPSLTGPSTPTIDFTVARNVSAAASSIVVRQPNLYVNETVGHICAMLNDTSGVPTLKFGYTKVVMTANGHILDTVSFQNLEDGVCFNFTASVLGPVTISGTANGEDIPLVPTDVYSAEPWPMAQTSMLGIPYLVPPGGPMFIPLELKDYFSMPQDFNNTIELKVNGTSIEDPLLMHGDKGQYNMTTPCDDRVNVTLLVDGEVFYGPKLSYIDRPVDPHHSIVKVASQTLVGTGFDVKVSMKSDRFGGPVPYRRVIPKVRIEVTAVGRSSSHVFKEYVCGDVIFEINSGSFFIAEGVKKHEDTINDYSAKFVVTSDLTVQFDFTVDGVEFEPVATSVDFTIGTSGSGFDPFPLVMAFFVLALLLLAICCFSAMISSIPVIHCWLKRKKLKVQAPKPKRRGYQGIN